MNWPSLWEKRVWQFQNSKSNLFTDLRINKHLKKFSYFANVFDVDIYGTPKELQMELIELQSSSELKSKFQDVNILNFFICILY